MDCRQMNFFGEQDSKPLLSYRGGSLASRTALQESARRLVMSVICGRKCGELLARLSPDGSWLKTYRGCYQVRMDGSLQEFSGILPRWGLMSDGELRALPQLEPYIDESEWRLLPTPTATDYKGGRKLETALKNHRGPMNSYRDFCKQILDQAYPNVEQMEGIMGFPKGYTEP